MCRHCYSDKGQIFSKCVMNTVSPCCIVHCKNERIDCIPEKLVPFKTCEWLYVWERFLEEMVI